MKIKYLLIIVFILFILASCVTNSNFIFDDKIPTEESVIVRNGAPAHFTVIQVNGIPVDWGMQGQGWNNIRMQLPAGNIELLIRIHIHSVTATQTITFNHPGARINYYFVAGNNYRIDFWPSFTGSQANPEQFFRIRNLDIGEEEIVLIQR